MLKALHPSIRHEASWWVWPNSNVVLCNIFNTLFIGWFSLFKLRLHLLRFPIAFWIIVCQNNNIMIDKPALFAANLLNAVACLILKTTYSAM